MATSLSMRVAEWVWVAWVATVASLAWSCGESSKCGCPENDCESTTDGESDDGGESEAAGDATDDRIGVEDGELLDAREAEGSEPLDVNDGSGAPDSDVSNEPAIRVDRCDESYTDCSSLDDAARIVGAGPIFLRARLEGWDPAGSVSWRRFYFSDESWPPCSYLSEDGLECRVTTEARVFDENLQQTFVVTFGGDVRPPISWSRVLPIFLPDGSGDPMCLEHGPWTRQDDVFEAGGTGVWATCPSVERGDSGAIVVVGVPEAKAGDTACRLVVGREGNGAWSWKETLSWPRGASSACRPGGLFAHVVVGDEVFVVGPAVDTWVDEADALPGVYEVGRVSNAGALFETVRARDLCDLEWPVGAGSPWPAQIAVDPSGAVFLFVQMTENYAAFLTNESGEWTCRGFFDAVQWEDANDDPSADFVQFGEAKLEIDAGGVPRLAAVLPYAGVVLARENQGSWRGRYIRYADAPVQVFGSDLDPQGRWNVAVTRWDTPELYRFRFDDRDPFKGGDWFQDLTPLLMSACSPPYCVCGAWDPYDPTWCSSSQSAISVGVDAAGRTHILVAGLSTPSAYATNLHGAWTIETLPELGYSSGDGTSPDHFAGNPTRLFVRADGALHIFYFDGKFAWNGEPGTVRHWARPCSVAVEP